MPDYIRQAAEDPSQGRFNDGDLAQAYRRNPLATDVRYWGHWMLEKAREELAEFYPPDSDGSVPVAYLWSRTIPCPSCEAEMPLIRQYWLARKDRKRVALEPVIDYYGKSVDFKVVEGPDVTGDPGEATTSRGDTRCLLCGQVVKGADVRRLSMEGMMAATMTAVVLDGGTGGKSYREDTADDIKSFNSALSRLRQKLAEHDGELSLLPDEPLSTSPDTVAGRGYGIKTFAELFNSRQLLALSTFARLVGDAHAGMLRAGLEGEYAKAVATYLGLTVDRLADYDSTITRWASHGEYIGNTFTRQAIPMVWDFAEVNPFSGATGDFGGALDWVYPVIEHASIFGAAPTTSNKNATTPRVNSPNQSSNRIVTTDPPYYDAINYSDLSDFFYVWLKRSIGFLHLDFLGLPLTPKREQIVMNVHAVNGSRAGESRREEARQRYVDGMAQSFLAMEQSLEDGGSVGVVFAHTHPDAWATLIEGLLGASLVPNASWPIDTELQNRVSGIGQARLSTSVWMSCRKREEEAGEAFLGDVLEEMRPVVRERLLYFWSSGIRGADFFISAIGPALSVFGRYERVLRPDGGQVSVRDFLDIVRRESATVALEQVLHGADLGVIDPVTRQYTTWVWSYSRAPLDAGEAIALCLATGASYADTIRAGSIAAESREKSKKMVRLRTVRQRAAEDEDLGFGTAARPAPLIDQLQYAAWLWGQNRTDDLGGYRSSLGETRWAALRTLGQAVAGCLPDDDEDRRIIMGLLGSNVMAMAPPDNGRPRLEGSRQERRLPGFRDGG